MSILGRLEKALNKKGVKKNIILDYGNEGEIQVWWAVGKSEDDFEDGELPTEGEEWEDALDTYISDAWYEFESDFSNTADYKGSKLYIYRMVNIESIPRFLYFLEKQKNIRGFKGIGVFWSWDKTKAEAHWGGRGKSVVITGLVSERDIEYERTVVKNLNPAIGKEEAEIEVKENAPITIINIEDEKGKVLWRANTEVKLNASKISEGEG